MPNEGGDEPSCKESVRPETALVIDESNHRHAAMLSTQTKTPSRLAERFSGLGKPPIFIFFFLEVTCGQVWWQTWNLCSAFNPSKCAHTYSSEDTHTPGAVGNLGLVPDKNACLSCLN